MIYSVINQKGGVGKTTLTCNLAGMLAYIHKKVLVIDLDPQSHSCSYFGFNDPYTGISDALLSKKIKPRIINVRPNLDIITPGYSMFEFEIGNKTNSNKLDQIIKELPTDYDYIFLDCPPSSGSIVTQALSATDKVIIPTTPEFLGMKGLNVMLSTLEKWSAHLNKSFDTMIIATKFKANNKNHKQNLESIRTSNPDLVFKTAFLESTHVSETPTNGKTIIDSTKSKRLITNITLITKEFLERT